MRQERAIQVKETAWAKTERHKSSYIKPLSSYWRSFDLCLQPYTCLIHFSHCPLPPYLPFLITLLSLSFSPYLHIFGALLQWQFNYPSPRKTFLIHTHLECHSSALTSSLNFLKLNCIILTLLWKCLLSPQRSCNSHRV